MSEAQRAMLVAALGAAAVVARVSVQAARTPAATPQRLVAEFRLIRIASLVLAATAGAALGLAVAHEHTSGAALEIALGFGFVVLAAFAVTRDPRQALTLIALGFVGHALLDIAHRPGLLPADLAPRWYLVGCAVYDSALAAVCYWPVLRR